MQRDELLDEEIGIKEIIQSISTNNSPKRIMILGGYKQGKSYALNAINNTYDKKLKFSVFKLSIENNPLIGINDFIPFINLLNKTEDIDYLNFKDKASKFVKATSAKADAILMLFSKKSIHSSLFNSTEISILERLKTVIGKFSTNIFLCDDLDKWDWASITLLNKILMDSSETGWLNSSHFIFTATNIEKIENIFNGNLEDTGVKTFQLRLVSKETLIAYLNKYQINTSADELYEFSGGNIGIISGVLDNTGYQYLSKEQVQSFLSDKLVKIVSDLNKANSTLEMVNRSAIAGKSFHKQILEEISEEDNRTFSEYLKYAKQVNIYNEVQSVVSFKIENLWSILYEHNKNNFIYHLMFANAIKKVIPSNFFVRATEYLLADSRQESAEAYFIYVVEYMKKYHKRILFDETFISVLAEFDFLDPLEKILITYEKYFNNDFECAKNIIHFEADNSYINFEKEYLLALMLINGSTLQSDYKDAVLILQNWIDNLNFKNDEPFLWVQAAILRVELASELNENVSSLLSEINILLLKYSGIDQQFKIELYSFKAKNNYTYSIDLSYKETQSAFQFFANEKSIPSKSQYACALVNYLANALVIGDYEDVIKISEGNAALFTVHEELSGYLSTFLNNYIISKILLKPSLNKKTAERYIEYFNTQIDNIADDKIAEVLYEINLGIIYFLAGRNTEAINLYSKLYKNYANESAVDDYYRYFIINNYFLINNFIFNKNEEFVTQLKTLNPLPNNRHFFIKRNEYLSMLNGTFQDVNSMIAPMGDGCILGKAWSFWGRPLLFTDVQFWTD